MVVQLLLLVCNIDAKNISVLERSALALTHDCGWMHLDVPHLDLLLLKSVFCLALAVVKCTVDLLSTLFYILADAVVFALHLA